MFKRAASVCTAVGATVVATGLVFAAPASASSTVNVYYGGGLSAVGMFHSGASGSLESFQVCDKRADGYGVNLHWYVVSNPANSGTVRDGDGADGDCHGQTASIGEGKIVKYQVCLTDGGVGDFYCNSWTSDIA